MPRKTRVGKGSGSQIAGNNVKPGTAAPSALKGKDTNKWDVTGQAKQMAEAQMDRSEPFLEAPLKGDVQAFPAIYGVDLKEKRRQGLLRDIATQQGPVAAQLGLRQVMLDDKTVDWIIREQDRIYMIERDMIFEASAKKQGLFDNPAGLEYLHKINPGYFSRRRKMAKWLVKTQLKLFDIAMDGVQNESDFDFMLMIQSLPTTQMKLIDTPAHKLSSKEYDGEGLYQSGAFRMNRLPSTVGTGSDGPNVAINGDNRQVPFAGFTSGKWGIGAMGPTNYNPASGVIGDMGGFNRAAGGWGGVLAGTQAPVLGGTGLAGFLQRLGV